MARPSSASSSSGLASLRRGGSLSELLFLYDCAIEGATRLRPIAARLGVTVQAVSHSYRRLSKLGLAELREGRYSATVAGIAWLHQLLGGLAEDVFSRQERLHIIRSCRAVALADLGRGEPVSLELVHGVLSARPGRRGSSRGHVEGSARKGSLVRVNDLEGILPLSPAGIDVITIPAEALEDPSAPRRLARSLHRGKGRLLAALGLEASYLAREAGKGPVLQFGVVAACQEASRVGVPSTLVVLEAELSRLLAMFQGSEAPRLSVRPLSPP